MNKGENNKMAGMTGTITFGGVTITGFQSDRFEIEEVIFNPPYTIINWKDKTKTIVKQGAGDKFDEEKGFTWAIAKRALGTSSQVRRLIEEANKPQEKIVKKKKNPKNSNSDDDIPF